MASTVAKFASLSKRERVDLFVPKNNREAAADTARVELTAHENLYIICTARPE
jgi:hypothetical protein